MNKERVGKLGTIALGASIALSACGGETPKPTPQPTITEAPTPSLVVTPTSEASSSPIVSPTPETTPSPTPETTPSPTPETTPSPYTLKSIIESKPQKIAASKVEALLKAAWENNESIKNDHPFNDYILKKWKGCQTPIGLASNPDLDKQEQCQGLMNYLSRTKNNPDSMDKYSYEAVKGVFNFAETTLPKFFGKNIITYFEDLLK